MTPHDDSPLARLQRWMQAVITHPGGVAEGAASDDARCHLADSPSGIEQVISRSQRLTSEERLAIYSHAYFARLLECLRAVFPYVAKTIGEEAFDDLALGYLERYPSRSYTLDRLGAEFPRYLEETRPDRDAEGRPTETWPDFLIELAKLEWVIGEVFDGPGVEGQPVLSADDLTAIPAERWPQARLKFVPCWRLLAFRFPLNDFYTALRNEEPPEIPEPAETFLALTRRDYIVRRHRLDRTQFELLSALAAGRPIGAAIEQAAKVAGPDLEGFVANLQSSFRDWTAAGFFQATDL
ncbi:MAG TPA: DNA-binding domain-containing protein [Pirellulales bacterium]|nr:DNA-binding domain-containing protein [Pirellulales bacterium]